MQNIAQLFRTDKRIDQRVARLETTLTALMQAVNCAPCEKCDHVEKNPWVCKVCEAVRCSDHAKTDGYITFTGSWICKHCFDTLRAV